jgi:hypothetical protein
MALTQDRDTKERSGNAYSLGVAAGKLIYAGAIVCLDANGNATPGAAAVGLICLGRAEQQADNSLGIAGAISVNIFRGVFRWENSAGGDAITEESIGEKCYIVDDQTVALTGAAGTRSVAGTVFDVDSAGVWVDTRVPGEQRKTYLTLNLADLLGADAAVYHIASPVSGRITKYWSNLSGALATGNATATGKIGGVAITNGVLTMVQAGSAAGQVNSQAPTSDGTNAVDVGSDISFTIGGTNTANRSATVVIEITRN